LCIDSIFKKRDLKSNLEDEIEPPEYKDHMNEIIDVLENKLDFGEEKLKIFLIDCAQNKF
jgi:hypothetical protein